MPEKKNSVDGHYVTNLKIGQQLQVGDAIITIVKRDCNYMLVSVMAPKSVKIVKQPGKKVFIAHVTTRGPKQ